MDGEVDLAEREGAAVTVHDAIAIWRSNAEDSLWRRPPHGSRTQLTACCVSTSEHDQEPLADRPLAGAADESEQSPA